MKIFSLLYGLSSSSNPFSRLTSHGGNSQSTGKVGTDGNEQYPAVTALSSNWIKSPLTSHRKTPAQRTTEKTSGVAIKERESFIKKKQRYLLQSYFKSLYIPFMTNS